VPKGHAGCIAARHTRTTADAAANAELPPKKRVAAQKRQARERDHSAATAAAVYEDPAPRRKTKRRATVTVEEVFDPVADRARHSVRAATGLQMALPS
jgi:hypothetical protein